MLTGFSWLRTGTSDGLL